VTAAQDAAVLYFALHGTDAPLTCGHIVDETVDYTSQAAKCGKTLAGICHDDGAPLCAEHTRTEGGRLLDEDTLAELWIVKRTVDGLSKTPSGSYYPPQSNLEEFAIKVAGIDPKAVTLRAPPKSEEARIRGRVRDTERFDHEGCGAGPDRYPRNGGR
jgi:hypothetical protein